MVIARALGIPAESPQQQVILRKRFISLKRQFPWIYGIFIVNLMGLHLAAVHAGYQGFNPTLVFLVVIAARLVHWHRVGNLRVGDENIQRELLKCYAIACLISISFCIWVLSLFKIFVETRPAIILFFANLAAIGTFYGLSSFPAAAMVSVYFLSLPMALMLMVSGDPTLTAVGLAQSFLILLMLRMLSIHDRGFVRLVSTRFDIETRRVIAVRAEQSALEEKARVDVIANTDPLTGLLNRRGLMEALGPDTILAEPHALVLFDLDGFKPINDTFGHPVGDKLLIEVGARLHATIGERGMAARLGGDEFALFFPVASPEEATTLARMAVKALGEQYVIDARNMSVSACAGVSAKRSGETPAELMREADIALYASKKRGRAVVELFSGEIQSEIHRKTRIEQALRQPGLVDMIDLAFQPIFQLDSLELRSFEALARWEHSELGWISPAEFIPITEQISAIEDLSESLLRRAATAALSWPASVKLSFNLSPVQLSTGGAGARLLAIIGDLGFPADRLQVEVTETALLADFDIARGNLTLLRQAGARIVLDDFGAGYASIGYLREINFDAIKLDGSLVRAITDAGPALPLLRGVLALCQAMGRQCIAEHIETDDQLQILRQLGCRYGQGFGLALPMSAPAAAELARTQLIDLTLFRSYGRPRLVSDNSLPRGKAPGL